MNSLDQDAADLLELVQGVLIPLQCVNAGVANGRRADLSVHQLELLAFLGKEGPRMMRELAEHLHADVTSALRLVYDLENKWLVRRHRSEEDGRIVYVELAEPGREIYQSLAQLKLRLFRTMLDALTEEEEEILLGLFGKIADTGRRFPQETYGILTGKR